MQAIPTVTTDPTLAVPEFISGAMTKLRPVLEVDLPQLARLMAAAPLGFNWEGEVWTVPVLKKKFEDEKDPGLWGATSKHYAVTDMEGALCGVLREDVTRLGEVDMHLHLAAAHPRRDELGRDVVAAFLAYKRSWSNCPRIEAMLTVRQTAEREWLLASGFEHEIRCAEAWLDCGEFIAIDIYAWLAPWVAANRAPDGIGQ